MTPKSAQSSVWSGFEGCCNRFFTTAFSFWNVSLTACYYITTISSHNSLLVTVRFISPARRNLRRRFLRVAKYDIVSLKRTMAFLPLLKPPPTHHYCSHSNNPFNLLGMYTLLSSSFLISDSFFTLQHSYISFTTRILSLIHLLSCSVSLNIL